MPIFPPFSLKMVKTQLHPSYFYQESDFITSLQSDNMYLIVMVTVSISMDLGKFHNIHTCYLVQGISVGILSGD
jgi:hypothetical protein